MQLDLSLVLNLANRAEYLKSTVESILHYCRSSLNNYNLELVLVDELSNDNPIEALGELKGLLPIRHILVDVHKSGLNVLHKNPALSINIGVLVAGAEKILKLQPETLFLMDNIEGAIKNCVDGRVALSQTYTGTHAFHGRFTPNFLKEISFDVLSRDLDVDKPNVPGKAYGIYPYVLTFTKKTFLEAGMCDIAYMEGWACEDDDWMLRHRRAGHEVFVTPEMSVYHMCHCSSEHISASNSRLHGSPLHHKNMSRFQKAIHTLNKENLQDNLQNTIRISQDCILSEEIL